MKHFLFFISFVALIFNCKAQTGNQIVLGKKDSIQSKILDTKRFFYVHMPNIDSSAGAAKKRYPVAYLFDADAQFEVYRKWRTVDLLRFCKNNSCFRNTPDFDNPAMNAFF